MTQQDKEDFEKNINCRFCEKEIHSDKVRDHCHLTGKHRGPAHDNCKINVTQKQGNFIPFVFHNFSKYDCRLFLKKLVDMKQDKVKFKILLKINEENNSFNYGCIFFIDIYRFLSSSLDKLAIN